jgi:NAD(P)-dependent dehydrogenase (short-subunit alcohol dehydrogenase family)
MSPAFVNHLGRNPDLAGQVALVTGGGRGLGRLLALGLAKAGAAVAVTARSEGQLAETVAAIRSDGGSAMAVAGHVADPRRVDRILREVEGRLGPVDLLVNNAGIGGPLGALWEVDPDGWWETFTVNLQGVFLFTRAVLPGMVGRGGGRVINVASHAGAFRWPFASAYAVSKAAVIKLTENLAQETRSQGIKIFAIHPGLLPIGLTEQALERPNSPDSHGARIAAWTREQIEQGHGANPQAAVDLVLSLASGRADPLSGCYLSVHDDLNAIVGAGEGIRSGDLYTLQIRRSPSSPTAREAPFGPSPLEVPVSGIQADTRRVARCR